jgi:hypothetical protein
VRGELLLERPVREVALILDVAKRQIDDFFADVELHDELVWRDGLQDGAHLPVDRVSVCGMGNRPLGDVLEVGVDGAHRRRKARLKSYVRRNRRVGLQLLEDRVRVLREAVVARVEAEVADTWLDAKVPRAGRVVHTRRSVGILVLRHVEVRRIGPVSLLEI